LQRALGLFRGSCLWLAGLNFLRQGGFDASSKQRMLRTNSHSACNPRLRQRVLATGSPTMMRFRLVRTDREKRRTRAGPCGPSVIDDHRELARDLEWWMLATVEQLASYELLPLSFRNALDLALLHVERSDRLTDARRARC
jgi:hypothetical protein